MLKTKNSELNISYEEFQDINGIRFTPREFDIISFILNGRTAKKISSLLSLSPKTVENYTRNIMGKVGCSSQEGIRDFIEKSGLYTLFRRHYEDLIISYEFDKIIPTIITFLERDKISFRIIHDESHFNKRPLSVNVTRCSLQESFNTTNITQKNRSLHEIFLYCTPQENIVSVAQNLTSMRFNSRVIFLLLDKENSSLISNSIKNIEYVDFSHSHNFYVSIFELLKMIFPSLKLPGRSFEFMKSDGNNFNDSGNLVPTNLTAKNSWGLKFYIRESMDLILGFINQSKKLFFLGCVLSIGLGSFYLGQNSQTINPEKLNDYGLTNIKWLLNRSDDEQVSLYNKATTEIVILLGNTGYRFSVNPIIWNTLTEKAKQGIKVKILVADPEKINSNFIRNDYKKHPNTYGEIREGILKLLKKIIALNREEMNKKTAGKITKFRPIEVALLPALSLFASDLIDGDIEQNHFDDRNGELTFIPKIEHNLSNTMLLFSFRNIGEMLTNKQDKSIQKSPYYIFREHIRDQWNNCKRTHQELANIIDRER